MKCQTRELDSGQRMPPTRNRVKRRVRLSIGKRPFCGNFYDVNVRLGSAAMIAITSSKSASTSGVITVSSSTRAAIQSRTAARISGRRLSFRWSVKLGLQALGVFLVIILGVGSIFTVAGGGEVAVARRAARPRRRIPQLRPHESFGTVIEGFVDSDNHDHARSEERRGGTKRADRRERA